MDNLALENAGFDPSGPEFFLPLSGPQQGIWYTEVFYPGTSINNIAGTLCYDDALDFRVLNEAFNEFTRVNSGVRLQISSVENGPMQYVSEFQAFRVEEVDLSGGAESEVTAWESAETQTPIFAFDAPLYRFYMLRFPGGRTGFYVKLHHLISDAWSIVSLGNQVMDIYDSILENPRFEAQPRPEYTAFVHKDMEYTASEKYSRDKAFWSEEFFDVPEIASIKARKTKNVSIVAERKRFYLPQKLVAKLRSYGEETRLSVFAIFMSALAIYINRVTGKEDVVLGVPSLNRGAVSEKETIGLFVTTVPIRLAVKGEETYDSFVGSVVKKWMNVLRHHKYPAYQIMRDVRDRCPGADRLYDVMISYQNAKFMRDSGGREFTSRWHFQGAQNESIYIHISDREDDDQILLEYDYLTDVFFGKDIEALHDHFIRILWHAIDAAPGRRLCDIEMVSENEKRLILGEFNNTNADFPQEQTMIDIFAQRVREMPDEVGVICGGREMTYRELSDEAERLAHALVSNGVKTDEVVALMAERSFEMMISILAIWMAGAAYMPIDPSYPAERIVYMLEHSGTGTLISACRCDTELAIPEWITVLDPMTAQGRNADAALPKATPGDLAYVIYTSGSTGAPKGVMNEHRALVNRINWMHKKYPISDADVILQKTTFTFDVSVWELTWWFFAGTRMVFLEPGGEKNPASIITAIERYGVTTMHFVPSMLGAFLTYLEKSGKQDLQRVRSLRRVFSSGEALTLGHTKKFSELLLNSNSTTLHNLYGPTEAAIDVSYYDCPDTEVLNTVPIGRPIDNVRLYIVNAYNKLQPINVAGELCIAGAGVARGYHNNPKLTSEKFVDNPFEPGTKMYRTGDLARWYPRGDIEYLGRMDSQIKIRGFRIELGDIHHHIVSHEKVSEVVVTSVADKSGGKAICAYVVAADGASPTEAELMAHVRAKLPEYMIPQSIVFIDAVPLSLNGKIDYKKLPAPKCSCAERSGLISPRSEMEYEIYAVWCDVLARNDFGVTDDFFSNAVGGDSIRAIEVVCALPKRDGALISISDFYECSTIEGLAALYLDGPGRKIRTDEILVKLSDDVPDDAAPMGERVTYICCPYGGGSAFVYRQFAQSMCAQHAAKGQTCSVYALNLPGHRFDGEEQSFIDIGMAADRAVAEIKENADIADTRLVVYAHCVGSALGLRIIRRLENENCNVLGLFVGASFPTKWISLHSQAYDPWRYFSDKQILKYLSRVGLPSTDMSEKTAAALMAAFRHDVREYFEYFKTIESEYRKPISSPIIAIAGDEDAMTRRYKSKAKVWRRYTHGQIDIVEIKGAKHYFMQTHADVLAHEIWKKLDQCGLLQGETQPETV